MEHKLMPKHGEILKVDRSEGNRQKLDEICEMQRNGTVSLMGLLESCQWIDANTVAFPCKQCILDTALQFRDLANAIEAILTMKRKADGCGND